MVGRLFALLVGINRYPPEVGALYGCVNDIDDWDAFLRESNDPQRLAIENLRDGEATRANLIRAFRSHLGRAGSGDVVLFHYSGHGARWRSAGAFASAFPDGRDEGLVCIDSRSPGGFDLADKELAVLVDDVARGGAHVAVVLDCCHAGSGTRNADAFRGLRARVTHEVHDERPLETYLDGHYADRIARGQPLVVPGGRHVLLAACERTQQARETRDNHGVFTATLLEVLRKSRGSTTYAELFVRCRDAVRLRADDQRPQCETYGHFDAWSGVLGRPTNRPARRFAVTCTQAAWRVDAGAVHGISIDPGQPASLTVFDEDGDGAAIGTALITAVGAQRSELRLDFAADTARRFGASLQSLPSAPLWIWIAPRSAAREAMQAVLDRDASIGAALADVPASARYDIVERADDWVLTAHGSPVAVHAISSTAQDLEAGLGSFAKALRHLAHWERVRSLANALTRIPPSAVEWVCAELAPAGGGETSHAGPEVALDGRDASEDGSAEVHAKLQVRNRSGQTLHFLLLHLSSDYGIETLYNEPLPAGDTWVTLYGDGPDDYFWVAGDECEAIDRFKLVVSVEKVDGFLMSCDSLPESMTRQLGNVRPTTRKFDVQDWTTREMTVRTVRRLDEVGPRAWSSTNRQLTIVGHPEVTASISLTTLQSAGRGGSEVPVFVPGFVRAGMQPVGFGTSRGGDDAVLELTDIRNADRMREHPLELVLDIPLKDDEGILPWVFDGQHVLPGGHAWRDGAGRTHVMIDHVHEVPAERRSLGGALKLYFFKTYLRRPQTNRLCAVDQGVGGEIHRTSEGLAARIGLATRVLLLVHGIIGDTDAMAEAVWACGLDRRFDLVLSYDYENLSTPIGTTARQLDRDLRDVGIGPDDACELTLLVHSMGGLVSRWFIEREGGSATVDHLVMCGTPNRGSPFGNVGHARDVFSMLTGLAANAAPWLVPCTAPLLFALNRSAKLTPTLEQMAENSDFMRGLNSGPPPTVRYTVLAGNVADYDEPGDPLFARLVTRLGQGTAFGLLFSHRPNDIAVTVDSIFGGGRGGDGGGSAAHRPVACHHLNYFTSRAGQAALEKVDW